MRPRHAATALVALGAASACALGSGLVKAHSAHSGSASLATASWSVQSSTDYGTSWNAPVLGRGTTLIPFRVDSGALHARAAYLPITLRTSVGTTDGATVSFGRGTLVAGVPAATTGILVRSALSASGSCSSATFDRESPTLLGMTPSAPVPVDAAPTGQTVGLKGGTTTTPGPAQTVCMEFTVDPSATSADGAVTLAWPVTIAPAGPSGDQG